MNSSILLSETIENVQYFYFLFVFVSSFGYYGVCMYVCSGRSSFKQKISTKVNQKKIKGLSDEYITKTRFKSWPIIFRKLLANKSLAMACLQNCQEKLFLTLRRVHSNLEDLFHLH